MVFMNLRAILVAAVALCSVPFSVFSAQSGVRLRLTRDLRIDAGKQDLSPIGSLAVAPNGGIVIAQDQDGLLRFFDARGSPLGTFGRKGQGPGEFQGIGYLAWIGDTLVVSDSRTRRFTLVSPDRKLVRTVPWMTVVSRPSSARGEPPTTSVLPFHLYADKSQLVSVVLRAETPPPAWLGTRTPGVLFLGANADGVLRRVLGWQPSIVTCTTAPFQASGSYMVVRIPFCMLPLHHVAMESGALSFAYLESGNGERFRFTVFAANGDTAFSRAVRFQRVPIPKAVRDSAIAALTGSDPAIRSALEKVQVPDFYPPVSSVLGGRDGSTWLEWYSQSGELRWEGFDAKGNSIGSFRVPRNIQIIAASRDQVWATETDDDGLQSVIRFRVTR